MPQNPLGATTLPSKVRVSAIRNSNFSVSAPARLNEKDSSRGKRQEKKRCLNAIYQGDVLACNREIFAVICIESTLQRFLMTMDSAQELLRWSLLLLDTAGRVRQARGRFCIAFVLVPFVGLYIIDFWLYVVRLSYYGVRVGLGYMHRERAVTKRMEASLPVPQIQPASLEPPRRRSVIAPKRSHSETMWTQETLLHKSVSETIHMVVDRVQEYLVQRNHKRPQLAARPHSSPKVDLIAT